MSVSYSNVVSDWHLTCLHFLQNSTGEVETPHVYTQKCQAPEFLVTSFSSEVHLKTFLPS